MEPLIDAETLLRRLDDPGLRFLDARFELQDPRIGRRRYLEGHVPGAMFVDRGRVRAALHDPRWCIIDVRSPERYRSETEPIDPIAGHIPSAVNRPYERTLGADGRFVETPALATQFAVARGRPEVVAYCGSGVSAAHAVLAMEVAGMVGARLYPGSWSDWCSYHESPVALGDEAPG